MLIGRTGLDIDRKRAADELGFTSKEDALSLRNLTPGEFYAFGPAISESVVKFKVGDVETSHPKAGDRILTNTTPPTAKIKALLGKLADLPQEAQQETQTLEDMRAENNELRRKMRVLERQQTKVETKIVADPEHTKAFVQIMKIAQKYALNHEEAMLLPTKTIVKTTTPISKKITGGAERIMQVLGSRHPDSFTKAQLALLANMSPKSGTFSTYLSSLKTQGLIEGVGDISLTETGIEYTASWDNKPQTQDEILDLWRGNLTGGARRMFVTLVDRYPESISKQELGEQTGMSYVSGTFSTYLSQLRRVGVIEDTEQGLRANRNLFIGDTRE